MWQLLTLCRQNPAKDEAEARFLTAELLLPLQVYIVALEDTSSALRLLGSLAEPARSVSSIGSTGDGQVLLPGAEALWSPVRYHLLLHLWALKLALLPTGLQQAVSVTTRAHARF